MNTFLHYIFFLINLPIYFAQTEDCIPLNNSIAINNNATDEWEIYTGAINYAIDISSIPGIINHPIPIQIREWLGVISTSYSAMALYEETALDFFGRPVWSDSLRRCRPVNNAEEVLLKNQAREAFAYSYLWSIQHFIPEWSDSMDLYAHTIGINLSECDDDVNSDCQNEEDPVYLAKLIVTDFIRIFSRDGWNADGSLNADVLLSVGTRNRFPYADWRSKNFNDYRHFNFCDEKWKAQNERCDIPSFLGIEQEDVCWRPPRHEYINLRYYKKQYTIPHIGDTGRSYFFKDSKIVGTLMEYPCHDVENDVRWVINRLNDLNDEKKSETEFFENVWLWMNSFLTQFWNENSPEETSYNKIISVLGTTASMYESTLIIWKEKMRIGFIRPETFVNTNFRGVNFDSYLGPTGKESGLIDGKNWVPFLSGSATGEFPSHGSCMCHAFTLAMQKYSGIENLSPQLSYIFAANSSLIEESMPSSHQNFSWSSWREITDRCMISRLNGGKTFPDTPKASNNFCTPIITSVLEEIENLHTGTVPSYTIDTDDLTLNEERNGDLPLTQVSISFIFIFLSQFVIMLWASVSNALNVMTDAGSQLVGLFDEMFSLSLILGALLIPLFVILFLLVIIIPTVIIITLTGLVVTPAILALALIILVPGTPPIT